MPGFPDDLNEHEEALIDAVSRGEAWNGMPSPPTPDQLADPAFVKTMPEIRAAVIRALCLGARNGSTAIDPYGIRIFGARITEALDLSFARIPFQLQLQRCHFARIINIEGSHLPHLKLSGSRFEAGLIANGARIEGSLFFTDICNARGTIQLLDAKIGGSVSFNRARLISKNGITIHGDRMKIGGNLFFRRNFRTEGEIKLVNANIGGNAEFESAQLINPGKNALSADGIKITGNLFYSEGFSIEGHAVFTAARIENLFQWYPKSWDGKLNLSHAHAGQWRDDWTESGWESSGNPSIDLKTFHYDALAHDNIDKNDAELRIEWIRRSLGDDFAPGPYETLAKALRAGGDDVGANQVGYAKAVDRAKHRCKHLEEKWDPLPRWLWKIVDRSFDLTVGYGYKPLRGVAWLAVFLILGWAVFMGNGPLPPNGTGLGIIKPSEPVIFGTVLKRQQRPSRTGPPEPLAADATPTSHYIDYTLPPEYTPFSPFWYSLDTLIPLVDLGQEGAWSPSPIDDRFWKDPGGWIVLIYLYIHILAGWVLSTLTVVALTGVIKKD